MEAIANYDFETGNHDELSFKKGDMLKILSMGDKIWYNAELHGQDGLIPANYVSFDPPYYFMSISKDDATSNLNSRKNGGNGIFLVRPSESTPGDLSLSVRIRDVQHFKILRTEQRDQYYLWSNAPTFKSINALVDYYKKNSVSKQETVMLRDSQQERVIASYDFTSRAPEELTLHRGDVITKLGEVDADWWEGTIERSGRIIKGIFPANYVTAYTN